MRLSLPSRNKILFPLVSFAPALAIDVWILMIWLSTESHEFPVLKKEQILIFVLFGALALFLARPIGMRLPRERRDAAIRFGAYPLGFIPGYVAGRNILGSSFRVLDGDALLPQAFIILTGLISVVLVHLLYTVLWLRVSRLLLLRLDPEYFGGEQSKNIAAPPAGMAPIETRAAAIPEANEKVEAPQEPPQDNLTEKDSSLPKSES